MTPVGKKQTTLLNISAESATFVTVYGHLYTKTVHATTVQKVGNGKQ